MTAAQAAQTTPRAPKEPSRSVSGTGMWMTSGKGSGGRTHCTRGPRDCGPRGCGPRGSASAGPTQGRSPEWLLRRGRTTSPVCQASMAREHRGTIAELARSRRMCSERAKAEVGRTALVRGPRGGQCPEESSCAVDTLLLPLPRTADGMHESAVPRGVLGPHAAKGVRCKQAAKGVVRKHLHGEVDHVLLPTRVATRPAAHPPLVCGTPASGEPVVCHAVATTSRH